MNDEKRLSLDEFLLARIAEDEARANSAAEVGPPPWAWQHLAPPDKFGLVATRHPISGRPVTLLPSRRPDVLPHTAVAEHIERHDPGRVLAECAFKRALLDAVEAHAEGEWEDDPIHHHVLTAMAAVYADHPDYDPTWRSA